MQIWDKRTKQMRQFWDTKGASCVLELQNLLRTGMVRRLAKQVDLNLPPKTVEEETFVLTTKGPEKDEYDRIQREMERLRPMLPHSIREMEILATKARVATAAWKAVDAPFLKRVVGLVKAHDRKCVVFAHHSSLREALCGAFEKAGIKHTHVSGEHSTARKSTLLKEFLAEEKQIKVAVLSTRALGVGVTLVPEATLAIKVDCDWTPGVEHQAEARIHRIGCKHPIRIIKLKASNTYDERLYAKLEEKAEANTATLGDDLALLHDLGIVQFAEFAPPPRNREETLGEYVRRVGEPCAMDEVETWPLLGKGEDAIVSNAEWVVVNECASVPSTTQLSEAWLVAGRILVVRRSRGTKRSFSSSASASSSSASASA